MATSNLTTENEIPYGYCQCGCGQKTTVSPYNHAARNMVAGEPRLFVKGHHCYSYSGGAKQVNATTPQQIADELTKEDVYKRQR